MFKMLIVLLLLKSALLENAKDSPFWKCSTTGIIEDENGNKIPDVKITGKFYIIQDDNSEKFYKEAPEAITNS